MAFLRMMYDSVYSLLFYIGGACLYYQYKSYEESMHFLTVLTCRIGAITLILLSANLFFSNFVHNFVHIIRMRELGPQRYLEETVENEDKSGKVQDTVEVQENASNDVGNEGAAENVGNECTAPDDCNLKSSEDVGNEGASNIFFNGAAANIFFYGAARNVGDDEAEQAVGDEEAAQDNGHEGGAGLAHPQGAIINEPQGPAAHVRPQLAGAAHVRPQLAAGAAHVRPQLAAGAAHVRPQLAGAAHVAAEVRPHLGAAAAHLPHYGVVPNGPILIPENQEAHHVPAFFQNAEDIGPRFAL